MFSVNEDYIGPVSFIISGIILFLFDNRRKKVIEGDIIQKIVRLPRVKNRNTLIWIEMRYWGIIMSFIGIVWLINISG